MVSAALRDGTADRRCVFEVFARRLPTGRRYGVVAGTGRLIERSATSGSARTRSTSCAETGVGRRHAAAWLADYRFTGDIDGYAEGELFFPGSPILTVSGTFAECVVLETLVLSVLNHDCAIAAAAARMVTAARGRPLIEMGSRRTHEEAAVAAARAAYLAGFRVHLQPGRRRALRHPHRGHRGARVHAAARRRADRVRLAGGARWARTPRCWSTRTTSPRASATRSRWPARSCGRSGSTPATWRCWPSSPASCSTRWAPPRPRSSSPATWTSTRSPRWPPSRSTCTARAPRWSPAPARRPPGWSTSWSRSRAGRWSSAPSTRRPIGGRKTAVRRHKPTGTATEEIIVSQGVPELAGRRPAAAAAR